MSERLQAHRWLAIILALFVALALIYSVATPIFEAGDELWHYPFVQHLASGNGLPVQDPNVETFWEQEGGQPPLYYALAALATFWIDTRDLPERVWLNPHAKIGIPLAFGNKNMVVHTSAENFPWHGTTLAVHLIRFLSIILSAITVALTYFFALVIASEAKQSPIRGVDADAASGKNRPRNDTESKHLAAFAAAIVAFNPMFIFISASVNNDNLATMLATLALYLLARLVTRGATRRRFVILGGVLGLGALTKISNLGLLLVAAFVFAYLLWKSSAGARARGRAGDAQSVPLFHSPTLPLNVVRNSLICATIVVLIAFWWYVRNWMLYDDLLAFNVWVQIAGGRPTPLTLASLLNEFQGFRISFWGNLGAVNLIAYEWVYVALDVFTLLAVVGLVIGLARRMLPRLLWLPTLWLVLIMLSLVRWTWLTMASQGRLIFPAISAVAVLFACGLTQFSTFDFRLPMFRSRITHYAFRFTFYVFLFTFATLAPFVIIAPAYALPSRFADDAMIGNRLNITFNRQAELVGYNLPQKSVKPGEELPLTIYWRAREQMTEDFSVYIRLLDAAGKSVGRWEAFPGGGAYPTRLWQPGEVIEDKYRIPVSLDARGPSVGRIEVGLFRRVPLETLGARDPQNQSVTPTVARFKIAGQANVQIENPVDYKFGDRIALAGYAPISPSAAGATLNVKLFWRALQTIDEDYTVFVHLVDANGKMIAQKDAPPQNGAYPTAFWEAGEIIADEYALAIPGDATPGDYRLVIGMYRASDGARLPVRDGDHIVLLRVKVN